MINYRNNESGWSSPPRTVITQSLSIDSPASRSSSKPTSTTNSISTDSETRLTTTDVDIKPIPNHIFRFVEQIQTELDQIKDEYRLKFEKDRQYIDQEMNLLIKEEHQTFEKLNRYLSDHRKRMEKRNSSNNKRKSSPSSSHE
jgi:hypothetical protein